MVFKKNYINCLPAGIKKGMADVSVLKTAKMRVHGRKNNWYIFKWKVTRWEFLFKKWIALIFGIFWKIVRYSVYMLCVEMYNDEWKCYARLEKKLSLSFIL